MNSCVIILSDKSSGSSALQRFLVDQFGARHIIKTRHYEFETLYWTKAASILGMPQNRMQNSEVPLSKKKALEDLRQLLVDNIPGFTPPSDYRQLVMSGWSALIDQFGPVFVEKSPHHLHQRSALDLILEFMRTHQEFNLIFICLIRNPLDTLYSYWKRFYADPSMQEVEWIGAYQNLIYLRDQKLPNFLIVRYEDLISRQEFLVSFLKRSIPALETSSTRQFFSRPKKRERIQDRLYGHKPTPELIQLAREFGYMDGELTQSGSIFWPTWKILRLAVIKPGFDISAWSLRLLRALRNHISMVHR